MSSEQYSSRPPQTKQVSPDRGYRNRFGSAQLEEQQVEAAMRELRERFDAAEAHRGDRRSAGDAIRYAWSILTFAGFSDFDEIKSVRTEEWPGLLDPSQHSLISLALEIVGWYQFGIRPYDIDRTARIFDRCLELTPHNQRALERFAIVANTIQPEDINGLAKIPKKQKETALGYKLQCKRKIDEILLDVFGVTEAHLVGQADKTVAEMVRTRKENERRFLFIILGHLSRLNRAVGDFFGNGTQLSLGTGAACCQLEILGLPRDILNLVTLLRSRLDEESDGQVAGEETLLVCDILETLAEICDSKWRIFKNQGAQRRAQSIRELLRDIQSHGIAANS